MQRTGKYFLFRYSLLVIVLLLLSFIDLGMGSSDVSFELIWRKLIGQEIDAADQVVLSVFRFPRVVAAVLAGAALAVSGLLMQTLFQNPLAGPYVLGINSGSSFLVALVTMSGTMFFTSDIGLAGAAMLGALLAGLFILFCSLYVRSKVSLLLVGIMFGAFTGAMVSVLQSYSSPDNLKTFMMWSFGSLQQLQADQMGLFSSIIGIGVLANVFLVKPLNLLLLGDEQASYMGVRIKFVRFSIVLVTAILAGTVTAFCGPIAFIGLIVPNITKMLVKTAHHGHLLFSSALFGAITLLLCDITMQLLPMHLPLNALTAVIGAPIVIWIIIKRF
jgi:iron complex transport system permease protein